MISRFSSFSQGASTRAPKSFQQSPPGGHNEPQERPRRRQKRPKRPQDGAKSRQERAKSATRATQEAPKRYPNRRFCCFCSWGASGRPPGAILEGFWARFWVLRAPFWSDSGTIVGSILKRVEVDFQTCWGQSSLLSLFVKFDVRSVASAAARMFSQPSPGSS